MWKLKRKFIKLKELNKIELEGCDPISIVSYPTRKKTKLFM